MEREQLVLAFKNEYGDNFTLRIDDPKTDWIDRIMIETFIEDLNEAKIFAEELIPVSAKIITTTVQEYQIDTV